MILHRKISLLVVLFLLTACGGVVRGDGAVDYDNTAFRKIHWQEKDFYFAHPKLATVDDANTKLTYNECLVNLGAAFQGADAAWEHKTKVEGDVVYDAWYGPENELLVYQTTFQPVGYNFWVQSSNAQYCAAFVDDLAESFSANPQYISNAFDFRIELPEGYEVKELDGGVGLRLHKNDISPLDPKDKPADYPEGVKRYEVEIVILPFENVKDYVDLTAFIIGEYDGYSSEFVTYDNISGFYVGEGNTMESTRHFFAMSKDAEVIYHLYLKLPNIYYNTHKGEFEKMVTSLTLL